MQVVWIAALCCAGPDLVGGGCSCMLLLLPALLTCTDAGPAAPDFEPCTCGVTDLFTLCI